MMLERRLYELEKHAQAQLLTRIVSAVAREPKPVGQAIARRLRALQRSQSTFDSFAALRAEIIKAIRKESMACADRIESGSSQHT